MRVTAVDLDPGVLAELAERLGDIEVRGDGDSTGPLPGGGLDEELVVVLGVPTDPIDERAVELGGQRVFSALTDLRPRRAVLLSSLRVFDAHDPRWVVTEDWSPAPTTEVASLVPYLAELALVHVGRHLGIELVIVRTDDLDPAEVAGAVAIEVLAPRPSNGRRGGLSVRHLGRPTPLGRAGQMTPVASDDWIPHTVHVLGAGGPLGAAAFQQLRGSTRLMLSDAADLAECASRPPQSPGAPVLPFPLPAPHGFEVVDLTDRAGLRSMLQGARCVVNCAVSRRPDSAFAVNVRGAYLTMSLAVELGIDRVVHTGPAQVAQPFPDGYEFDRMIDESAPPRPGDDVYLLSKLLAQEIVRIFAEQHSIDALVLLFLGFAVPGANYSTPLHPFAISWADAGRAVAAAVSQDRLPSGAAILHLAAPSPHGRYRLERAAELIGFRAQDSLDHHWRST